MRVTMRLMLCFLCIFFLQACVSTVEKKTEVDPQKALEANIKLGMAYLQRDDRDRALLSFSKAMEINKRSADAHHGLALVHQLNSEDELAEKRFKEALKLKSDFSMAGIQLSYARFLYENKRYAEAVPLLEESAAEITYRNRERSLYLAGLCELQLGNTEKAAARFDHALNLDKRYAAPAIELATIRFEERNYAEAKKYLDQFTSNAPRQSPRSLLLGIKIERIFGNKDKEASYALALKNLHPYSKEYLEYKNQNNN